MVVHWATVYLPFTNTSFRGIAELQSCRVDDCNASLPEIGQILFRHPHLSPRGGLPYRVAVADSRLPQNPCTSHGVDTHPA